MFTRNGSQNRVVSIQKRILRNCLETPLRKRKSRAGVVLELTALTTDFMYNLPQPYEISSNGCIFIGWFRVSANPLTIREYEYDFDLPKA